MWLEIKLSFIFHCHFTLVEKIVLPQTAKVMKKVR